MKQFLLFLLLFVSLFISVTAQDEDPLVQTPNLKEFAGRYSYGTWGNGAFYKLFDDGRFEYSTFSDCCDPVWKESGTYTFKDEQLHFNISKSTLNNYDLRDPKQASEAFRKLYDEKDADAKARDFDAEYDLQVIKWGERIYLIEPARLHLFVAAINFGIEPRPEMINNNFLTRKFFLRAGDEDKPVTGKPQLPESLRTYLQDSPLPAAITKIGSQEGERVFLINKGSADGVDIGMAFVGENVEPKYDNLLWVISVDEKSAKLKSFSLSQAYQYQLNNTLTTKIVNTQ